MTLPEQRLDTVGLLVPDSRFYHSACLTMSGHHVGGCVNIQKREKRSEFSVMSTKE